MKTFRSLQIVAGLLVLLAVVPAFAQVTGGSMGLSLTFTAPMAFNVQNTKLPAGAYTVSQLGVGQPNVLVLRSVKPGHEVLVEVSQMPSSPNDKAKSSQVTFSKYGNNDFLNEIWFVSDKKEGATRYQVLPTAAEKMQTGTPTKHSVAGK